MNTAGQTRQRRAQAHVRVLGAHAAVWRRWILAIVAGVGAIAARAALGPDHPTFTEVTVHDPSVVRDGGTFYVFGSHLASARSTDLMHWVQISTSPAVGNALVPNPAVEFQAALAWAQTDTFWAPDVIRLPDGKYYFYYCACQGTSSRSALGLAVADQITGPYRNVGIMLESGMWGQPSPDGQIYDNAIHPNTVDPSVFFDQTGKYWMVYGSYSGGIFILAMDPATGQPIPGQAYGKKLIGGNNSTIEGPYIIYSPETAYYYLFFTFGGLDANGGYNIRYGRSRGPDGPYLDAAGNDLTQVKGAPGTLFDNESIAPYAVKLMGNWQFLHVDGETGTTSRGYVSPGGVSIYRDAATAQYFMVFHTRFVGRGEEHEVRVHQLYLNADGWFVAAPQRYAGESIGTLDPNQVPGDYKLINHGKAISAAVSTSTVVTLGGDGTVTGAASGTWQAVGDHFATLTLVGTTYRGVFSWQWDDDNQQWLLTFSAVSTDGVSIWGSRVAKPIVVAAPVITHGPTSQSLILGQPWTLTVQATATPAPAYQWKKDGVAIVGATNSSFSSANGAAADAGSYTVEVSNAGGTATSTAALVSVPSRPAQVSVPAGSGSAHIVNLSARGIVSSGDDVLIAGFVISGPAPKKLLITGWGQALRNFGVADAIARPQLTLTQRVGDATVTLAQNDDWRNAGPDLDATITQVGGQHFGAPSDVSHGDAAILVTLPAGQYTVVEAPHAASANAEGVGLVELYDVDLDGDSKLINISARGRVETGARQMIVGVSIGGTGSCRLLVRGIGPTLKAVGVGDALINPAATLYQNQIALLTNDDWWFSAQADQIADLSSRVGAFTLGAGALDAAILFTAAPGSYSTIVSPSDSAAGVALAEIYDANVAP